jgi:hypothetical protein
MSARRALTTAVRDHLRQSVVDGGLAIPAHSCDVMFDGRPPANCGKWFYAIYQGPRSNRWLSGDQSEFGVNITITARANEPFDRIGTALVDWATGLDDRADAVWQNIFSHQWTGATTGIMNRANTLLTGWPDTYGFTEALYPTNMSNAQPVREDWFSATDRQQHKLGGSWNDRMPFCGLTITIQLMGAVRLQNNSDAGA